MSILQYHHNTIILLPFTGRVELRTRELLRLSTHTAGRTLKINAESFAKQRIAPYAYTQIPVYRKRTRSYGLAMSLYLYILTYR